jgi:hypothetical protein
MPREAPHRKYVEEIKELNSVFSSTSTSDFETDFLDVSGYRKVIIIVRTDSTCEVQLIFSDNTITLYQSFTVAYGTYRIESDVLARNMKIKVVHGSTPTNFNLIIYTL